MIKKLYKIIRRYSVYLLIFITVFTIISLAYFQFRTTRDGDSGSYYYFVRMFHGETLSFPDIMRPPIYPFLLLVTTIISGNNFSSALFFIQTGFLSLGFVFLYILGKRIFKNAPITCLILFFCLIFYPATRLVNLVGPESLMMIGVIIFIYISSYIQKNAAYMLLIVLLLTILTFTKPIFLYFPIVLCIFYIFLWWKRFLTKKHIITFGITLIFLYVLPVLLWSYGNKLKSGYFTFSNIQEINIVGKLLQYNMVDKGPDIVDKFPVKQLIVRSNKTDPYALIRIIEEAHKTESWDKHAFELSLYEYGNVVMRNNLPEYVMKSFYLIPFILSDVTNFSLHQPDFQIVGFSGLFFQKIIILYQYYFIMILQPLFNLLLILSVINGIRYYIDALNKKISTYSYVYLLLSILLAYVLITITFSSFDDNFRLMVPYYFEIILLFSMTLCDLVRGARTLSRSLIK